MLLGLPIKYMVRGIEQLRAKDEPGAKEVNGDIILYFAVMSVLSNCGSLLAGLYFSGKRRDSRRPNADNSDAVAVPLSSRASLQRLVSCDKVNDERGDGSDADGKPRTGTATEETRWALENLKQILEEAGSSLERVVQVFCLVQDKK